MQMKSSQKIALGITTDDLSEVAYDLASDIEGLGFNRVWVVLTQN